MENFSKKLSKNIPKGIEKIIENTNLIISGEPEKIVSFGSAKKNGGTRNFYIVPERNIASLLKLFDDNEIEFKKILNFISSNNNIMNPIVTKNDMGNFEFHDFDYGTKKRNIEIISDIELGKREQISTDINFMYDHTYTHSISWAFFGKDFYKEWFEKNYDALKCGINDSLCKEKYNQEEINLKIFLNKIDSIYRNEIRGDRETVGLLTGIPVSDLIADFILTGIDNEIKKFDGYGKEFDFYHFKDNYTFVFYFKNWVKMEKFMKKIIDKFSEYKYQLKVTDSNGDFLIDFENNLNLNELRNILKSNNEKRNNAWQEFEGYYDIYADQFVTVSDNTAEIEAEIESIDEKESEDIDKYILSNLKSFNENKKQYMLFKHSHRKRNEKLKLGTNSWINDLFNNPSKILKDDNLAILSKYVKKIDEKDIFQFIDRFIETTKEYLELGYELEFLAIISLFYYVTGNLEFIEMIYSIDKFKNTFKFSECYDRSQSYIESFFEEELNY